MKEELIKAIRETIIDLEEGRKHYEWSECESCNCGLLAQNICGIDREQLTKKFGESPMSCGVWSDDVRFCTRTGDPIGEVIQKMLDVGLSAKDIQNLEYLSDPEILKEAGYESMSRSEKPHLIAYLKAWLNILTKEA